MKAWLDINRGFLTLVALAAASAAVFVWGSQGYRERDALQRWVDVQCAAAGKPYAPPKGAPGKACGEAIRGLAAFKADTNAATAQILANAVRDRDAKTARAITQAQSAARAAQAAALQMETANAAVQDDNRVGPGWFGALNRSGGLRDPSAR